MFHHKPSILGVPHLWKPPMDSKWIGIHIVSIPFRMLRPLRAWQQAAILCGKGVPVAKWRLGFSRKVSIYADLCRSMGGSHPSSGYPIPLPRPSAAHTLSRPKAQFKDAISKQGSNWAPVEWFIPLFKESLGWNYMQILAKHQLAFLGTPKLIVRIVPQCPHLYHDYKFELSIILRPLIIPCCL